MCADTVIAELKAVDRRKITENNKRAPLQLLMIAEETIVFLI